MAVGFVVTGAGSADGVGALFVNTDGMLGTAGGVKASGVGGEGGTVLGEKTDGAGGVAEGGTTLGSGPEGIGVTGAIGGAEGANPVGVTFVGSNFGISGRPAFDGTLTSGFIESGGGSVGSSIAGLLGAVGALDGTIGRDGVTAGFSSGVTEGAGSCTVAGSDFGT